MGAADLHIHSIYSDGTATVNAILHHASTSTELDVIAITDHDTLQGALRARDQAAQFRIDVVPGMEITTSEGHLLALFLQQPVKSGMSYLETAEQVRLFGGLPFAAHPAGYRINSIGAARLRRLLERYPGLLAGVEAENGSLIHLSDNERAQTLRWELGLPGLGNSDAHMLDAIGCAYTAFPGKTAGDLRRALETGAVVPMPATRTERFFRRHATRYALRFGAGVVDALDVRGGDDLRVRWRRVTHR